MLVTVLAAAEDTELVKEHDNVDGEHSLFADHEGALVSKHEHDCTPQSKNNANALRNSSWKSSRSPRGSDTTLRLEERVRALEREQSDVAARAERVRTEAEVEAEQNLIRLL